MSLHAPKINKLPFLVTDLVFLGVALAIIMKSSHPIGGTHIFAAIICVALGAWAGITPFLRDHEVQIRHAETDHLKDTVSEIKQLKTVANYIQTATAQWQMLQENSNKATGSMKEMAERLSADAKDFSDSVRKASDSEKQTLRLEVEKLKRAEGEGLKIMVALLDHVYALYSAGVRSGQPNVVQQLTGFQAACRDVVRRVGLVPIEVNAGESFDPNVHQVHGGDPEATTGAPITGTLATGYTYQGQMLRPALVTLRPVEPGPTENKISEEAESPAEKDPNFDESASDDFASDSELANEENDSNPLV
jgi:molecular chaperone GrpE (heat shock protein)